MGSQPLDVVAVVVDYNSGAVLGPCVDSVLDEAVSAVIVVENGELGPAATLLAERDPERLHLMGTHRNIGYGAGVNRGVAAAEPSHYILVCNPDLEVHPGAVSTLVEALGAHPEWAIVGPRILTSEGAVYPSARRFPSMAQATGHALLGQIWPDNPFSRRYRDEDVAEELAASDWVSGACFLARRSALDELGGFDESYFMFLEEVDLCWRAHQAGWGVGIQPAAVVTHVEGVTRRARPYRSIVDHHRSALRFARRSSTGWRSLALPVAAMVLGVRMVQALALEALARRPEAT
jgi:N-acetylglucosaminyl-diphospho-decaprenol L-rhamnosyltransferase